MGILQRYWPAAVLAAALAVAGCSSSGTGAKPAQVSPAAASHEVATSPAKAGASPLRVALPDNRACRAVPSDLLNAIVGGTINRVDVRVDSEGNYWCDLTSGTYSGYIMLEPHGKQVFDALVKAKGIVQVAGTRAYDTLTGGYDGVNRIGDLVSVGLGRMADVSSGQLAQVFGSKDAAIAAVSAFAARLLLETTILLPGAMKLSDNEAKSTG